LSRVSESNVADRYARRFRMYSPFGCAVRTVVAHGRDAVRHPQVVGQAIEDQLARDEHVAVEPAAEMPLEPDAGRGHDDAGHHHLVARVDDRGARRGFDRRADEDDLAVLYHDRSAGDLIARGRDDRAGANDDRVRHVLRQCGRREHGRG